MAYAVWVFASGRRLPDQLLYYVGIAAGSAAAIFYLRAAKRWTSRDQGGYRESTPIEPS